jgi:hypothetical protein
MYVHIGRYTDSDEERDVNVVIHKYDTWSMDHTLAVIVEPMLKQLKDTMHGAPYVELEDVPSNLYPTKKDEYGTDNTHFERWDWVLDEMIWAFEQKNLDDWEEQYWIEHPEFDFDSGSEVKTIKEGKCDWEGRKAHQDRMSNGFRLFGKYFENLWD